MSVLSAQSIGERLVKTNLLSPYHLDKMVDSNTGCSYGLSHCGYDIRLDQELVLRPGNGFFLGSSLEKFNMPQDLVARVHDKSTLARLGIFVQNTIIEPGWRGHLTLEISYHGDKPITWPAGGPIAQIIFELLDRPTKMLYTGKYQDQKRGIQEAILESANGNQE